MALTLQYRIDDVTPSGTAVQLDVRLLNKADSKQLGQVYVTADLAAIDKIKSDPALTGPQKVAAIKALVQAAVAEQTAGVRASLTAHTDLSPLKGLTWDA